ncbi:MAG TPA: SIR2 family protein, partial [Rhodocyclaceae bacterium]|nr:SIR2 family protein [Rhodocyclaceae bacterium]
RAAMNVELKRGRSAVTRFLNQTYGDTAWTRGAVHEWIKALRPPYVIDINRDTQLQDSYADAPHNLVVGVARIGGTDYRYKLYFWDGAAYTPAEDIDPSRPILFKPMGTPRPAANYIASDADYVDFITELMGGFAVPPEVKEVRQGKRYLCLGLRLNRDTERMVLSDMIYAAASPAGWALIPEPTDKERRFCKKLGLEIVEADVMDLLAAAMSA